MGRSTLGRDGVHPNWRIQTSRVLIRVDVSEDPVVRVQLNLPRQLFDRVTIVTNEALAPRVGMAELVNGIRRIVAALDLHQPRYMVPQNVPFNPHWVPPGLLVACSQLAVSVEAPHEQLSVLRESSCVPKSC